MSILDDRSNQLRDAATRAALQLTNEGTAPWFKYNINADAKKVAADDFNVDGSADMLDRLNELFNRDEFGKTYMENIASTEDLVLVQAIKAKLSADVLASMQQATGLRYASRIRHMMAAASRCKSIGNTDADIVKLRV